MANTQTNPTNGEVLRRTVHSSSTDTRRYTGDDHNRGSDDMFGACVKKEHLALFQVQRSAHTPDDKGGMRFATRADSDWVTFGGGHAKRKNHTPILDECSCGTRMKMTNPYRSFQKRDESIGDSIRYKTCANWEFDNTGRVTKKGCGNKLEYDVPVYRVTPEGFAVCKFVDGAYWPMLTTWDMQTNESE